LTDMGLESKPFFFSSKQIKMVVRDRNRGLNEIERKVIFVKQIYRLRVETMYYDKCNPNRTIEYERDRFSGEILCEEHIGYFDSIEEAKGMMLLLERNMTDNKSFEKVYFHSSGNDRMHIVQYEELDVKGRLTKAGTGFKSILTISSIQLGSMLY